MMNLINASLIPVELTGIYISWFIAVWLTFLHIKTSQLSVNQYFKLAQYSFDKIISIIFKHEKIGISVILRKGVIANPTEQAC